MKEKILLVDAGHGGISPLTGDYTTDPRTGKRFKHKSGTFHKGTWFYEGVSNRHIAADFIAQASKAGFVCVPTFQPSKDSSLMQRIRFANHFYDNVSKNCLLISFHSDAFNSKARGFQVFHYPTSSGGRMIAENLAATVAPVFEDYGSIRRFGNIRVANFAMLRATKMPAVLLENGFFDNKEDAELLMEQEFIQNVNRGIIHGLNRFC